MGLLGLFGLWLLPPWPCQELTTWNVTEEILGSLLLYCCFQKVEREKGMRCSPIMSFWAFRSHLASVSNPFQGPPRAGNIKIPAFTKAAWLPAGSWPRVHLNRLREKNS